VDNSRVLLERFVDGDRVIAQVERDDETAVEVLGHAGVEAGREAEDLLVVIERFEFVDLRTLGHKALQVTQRVFLTAHKVGVGRHRDGFGLTGKRGVVAAEREGSAVLGDVVLLCVFVDAEDTELVAEDVNDAISEDLVAGQVVVTDEGLTGLLDFGVAGELSPG